MQEFFPSDYINPRRIAVPVLVPDSIANCYINMAGIADFTGDPEYENRVQPIDFRLRFDGPLSPLETDDLVIPEWTMATVALAHMDCDEEGGWAIDLNDVIVNIMVGPGGVLQLEVVVYGDFGGDAWIDTISYEIDLLAYRPNFNRQKPKGIPWSKLEQFARRDNFPRFHLP